MRQAADADEFWRAPVGCYVAGRTYILFCASADLYGYVMWGSIDEQDFRATAESVFHAGWTTAPPHRSVLDLRRVTSIDPAGFSIVRSTQAEHRDQLARRVTKMAIIRPDGFIGAIAEGIANVASFPHPVEVVATVDDAAARLDIAPSVFAELDAAVARLEPGVVASLHAVMSPELELAAAAKQLGMSPRNLQRKLRELGTSFLAEKNLAQVRLAQKMMVETDATLSQIALDAGCRSLQHFSTLFRRVTGETPSQWRLNHRR